VITDLPDITASTPLAEQSRAGGAAGGRRTLTVGAIRVAYGLFAAVGGTLALVGFAAAQLLSAAPATPQ
jgi:hypothetical protein